jgi:predicted nucleic acid-binding protein
MTGPDAETDAPIRVVFDTNVAVAILVFADPQLKSLAARWDGGELQAVADAATLAEFDRVLRYPELKLDEARALAIAVEYRARCVVVADAGAGASRLPQCADPDDQMFVSLAERSGARWLLTRDKALLDMRGKVGFRIGVPEGL